MDDPIDPCQYGKEIKLCKSRINGYLYFCDSAHPLALSNGVVYYHRHIASVAIGRWILPGEHVHHKDGDIDNNDPSNLEVLSGGEHFSKHMQARWEASRVSVRCRRCGKTFKTPRSRSKKFCSPACVSAHRCKCERPSKEELASLIEKYNWTALGRLFGVSDNAVRNWARRYELL